MQLRIPKRYYTPEEYLELEEAECKSEYHDGEIVPRIGCQARGRVRHAFWENFLTEQYCEVSNHS